MRRLRTYSAAHCCASAGGRVLVASASDMPARDGRTAAGGPSRGAIIVQCAPAETCVATSCTILCSTSECAQGLCGDMVTGGHRHSAPGRHWLGDDNDASRIADHVGQL